MNEFKRVGNEIFAIKSGRLVCKVKADNSVTMEPGMAAPYKRKVEAWVSAGCPEAETDAVIETDSAPDAGKPAPEAEKVPEENVTVSAGWNVEDKSREELPAFDPCLGTSTPGFKEFCRAHNLNNDEITALVRKLEKGVK